MPPKKSLGQNFLTSTRAIEKILEAGDLQKGELVLEIGPGRGVLTKELLVKGVRVLAVEKDDDLIPVLEQLFEKERESGQFTLVHGDILEFDPEKHGLAAGKYKLIANIPYYITGALFKMFIGGACPPSRAVILVQKEVAERIVGRDGKESVLSISVKAYGVPHYVETVKAGSFVPAPNVDSAILLVETISKDFFKDISEEFFFKVLKTGFAGKRKQLAGNLKELAGSREAAEEILKKAGVDTLERAENVPPLAWKKITELLIK